MRLILTVLILLSSASAKSQAYQKMLGTTNEWNVSPNFLAIIVPPHSNPGTLSVSVYAGDFTASSDSILNSLSYKKTGLMGWPLGLLREDTALRRVFFIEDGTTNEIVLYDFSLNVNDSIYLQMFQSTSGNLPTGWDKVDSSFYQNTYSGLRKHMYLSNSSGNINFNTGKSYFMEWIEGIGNPSHPFYPYADDMDSWGPFPFSCSKYFSTVLACKSSDGVKKFFDACLYNNPNGSIVIDSCHYQMTGGIEDYAKNIDLKIYPVPATHTCTVSFELGGSDNLSLEIINGTGVCVYREQIKCKSGKNNRELNISQFPSGLYFIRGNTSTGCFANAFAVCH